MVTVARIPGSNGFTDVVPAGLATRIILTPPRCQLRGHRFSDGRDFRHGARTLEPTVHFVVHEFDTAAPISGVRRPPENRRFEASPFCLARTHGVRARAIATAPDYSAPSSDDGPWIFLPSRTACRSAAYPRKLRKTRNDTPGASIRTAFPTSKS